MKNGYEWHCDEGHTTQYHDGKINVLDYEDDLLFTRHLNEKMKKKLDEGECPICDCWE